MHFAILMVWREPTDHTSNCYFCMIPPVAKGMYLKDGTLDAFISDSLQILNIKEVDGLSMFVCNTSWAMEAVILPVLISCQIGDFDCFLVMLQMYSTVDAEIVSPFMVASTSLSNSCPSDFLFSAENKSRNDGGRAALLGG